MSLGFVRAPRAFEARPSHASRRGAHSAATSTRAQVASRSEKQRWQEHMYEQHWARVRAHFVPEAAALRSGRAPSPPWGGAPR